MPENHVQSIVRAFDILKLLRDNGHGLGVSEISKELEMSVGTIHRLLQTLVLVDAVEQDKDSKQYSLATEMLFYGKSVLDRYDFITRAHPIMGELSKKIGETVFMGILEDYELVYVDHVDSLDHFLRMPPQIGRRQSAHCTAQGKVLLAHLPLEEINTFLQGKSLYQFTENTITDPEELHEELATIRQIGFAMDREETEIGICCVAAPVRKPNGEVVAAISTSGPATRMLRKGLDTVLKEEVVETAHKISRLMII